MSLSRQNSIRHNVVNPHSRLSYFLAFAVMGYLIGGRGFAELHIPGIPLFFGEFLLAIGLFGIVLHKGVSRVFSDSSNVPLLIMFGVAALGLERHFSADPILCLRDSTTAFYLLFIVVFKTPAGQKAVQMIWRWLQKWGVALALLYLLQILFKQVFATVGILPGHSYAILQNPNNIVPLYALLILLISLEGLLRNDEVGKNGVAAAIALAPILLTPCRGATLGSVCALTCYIIIRKPANIVRIVQRGVAPVFFVAIAGVLVYLLIPPQGGESTLQLEEIPAKFVALVSADGGEYKSSTGTFRINWWLNIIDTNMQSNYTLLMGQGWGTHLGELVGLFEGTKVRAAHSAWANMIGWLGFIGLAAYLLVFFHALKVLLRYIAKSKIRANETFLSNQMAVISACWLVGVMVTASFDNGLNNPAVCIPLFSILGGVLGIVLDPNCKQRREERLRGMPP